jgi:hypothetical protein
MQHLEAIDSCADFVHAVRHCPLEVQHGRPPARALPKLGADRFEGENGQFLLTGASNGNLMPGASSNLKYVKCCLIPAQNGQSTL